jgi:hypothetical protein
MLSLPWSRNSVRAPSAPRRGGGRWLLLAALVAVVAIGLGILAEVLATSANRARYDVERSRLNSAVATAQAEGYTAEDLRPITSDQADVEAARPPIALTAGFYADQAARESNLHRRLDALKSQLVASARDDITVTEQSAAEKLKSARQQGADDGDLAPVQVQIDEAHKSATSAHGIKELRAAAARVHAADAVAGDLASTVAAERQAILQGAADLKAQTQGNLDAMRKAGQDALAAGRNDASLAAYMKIGGLDRQYHDLERFAGQLGLPDPEKLAYAASAERRYAAGLHDLLMQKLPVHTIVISAAAQELWAYDGGKVAQDTVVTTGRPPELATDMGAMKVVRKDSPWKMHSPWPKGSPYWYPDATVQYVVWFTNTGEGMHDAYWQPCCWGPGSQYTGYASHGCVHVPFEVERWLFRWADIGTPVIVYPGDGTPPAQQLAQKSTDDNGIPLTGPKGA